MNGRLTLISLAGVAIGAGAAATVIWFLIKHARIAVVSTATGFVVVGLLALLVAVTTNRASGVALFGAAVTVLFNDVLLSAKFATILGFCHLSLADSIGLWPASAFLVLAISSAYLSALMLRKRWVLGVTIVLTILVSWPARLSSQFFL